MKIPHNHKRYIVVMLLQIFLIVILEVSSICLAWFYKSPMIFIGGLVICLLLAILLAKYYYAGAFFKCSVCETTFKPSQIEFMRNVNVKRGRVLTCPKCSKKVQCKEGFVYGGGFR